jgi:hypothetical protein
MTLILMMSLRINPQRQHRSLRAFFAKQSLFWFIMSRNHNETVIGGLLPGKILWSQRLPLVKH